MVLAGRTGLDNGTRGLCGLILELTSRAFHTGRMLGGRVRNTILTVLARDAANARGQARRGLVLACITVCACGALNTGRCGAIAVLTRGTGNAAGLRGCILVLARGTGRAGAGGSLSRFRGARARCTVFTGGLQWLVLVLARGTDGAYRIASCRGVRIPELASNTGSFGRARWLVDC